MNKYFLDFGTQHGSGLYRICALENFDQNVEIHSFEANPYTFKADVWKKAIDKRPDLKDTKAHCEKMVHYYNIGVSGDTGFYHFNCEEDQEGGFTGSGSSLLDLSCWNTEKNYNWKEGERFSKNKSAQVFCLSIIDLLALLLPDKTEKSIIAKFDIEGAEYSVFEALEATDNFKWFSKLYVEFHDTCITTIDLPKKSRYWIESFKAQGIEFVPWD